MLVQAQKPHTCVWSAIRVMLVVPDSDSVNGWSSGTRVMARTKDAATSCGNRHRAGVIVSLLVPLPTANMRAPTTDVPVPDTARGMASVSVDQADLRVPDRVSMTASEKKGHTDGMMTTSTAMVGSCWKTTGAGDVRLHRMVSYRMPRPPVVARVSRVPMVTLMTMLSPAAWNTLRDMMLDDSDTVATALNMVPVVHRTEMTSLACGAAEKRTRTLPPDSASPITSRRAPLLCDPFNNGVMPSTTETAMKAQVLVVVSSSQSGSYAELARAVMFVHTPAAASTSADVARERVLDDMTRGTDNAAKPTWRCESKSTWYDAHVPLTHTGRGASPGAPSAVISRASGRSGHKSAAPRTQISIGIRSPSTSTVRLAMSVTALASACISSAVAARMSNDSVLVLLPSPLPASSTTPTSTPRSGISGSAPPTTRPPLRSMATAAGHTAAGGDTHRPVRAAELLNDTMERWPAHVRLPQGEKRAAALAKLSPAVAAKSGVSTALMSNVTAAAATKKNRYRVAGNRTVACTDDHWLAAYGVSEKGGSAPSVAAHDMDGTPRHCTRTVSSQNVVESSVGDDSDVATHRDGSNVLGEAAATPAAVYGAKMSVDDVVPQSTLYVEAYGSGSVVLPPEGLPVPITTARCALCPNKATAVAVSLDVPAAVPSGARSCHVAAGRHMPSKSHMYANGPANVHVEEAVHAQDTVHSVPAAAKPVS